MDMISIFSVDNTKIDVEVIRFFNLNGNKYLVYSLNEVDDQSYVKLYAVKISGDEYSLIGSNIVDENEWNVVKEKIKTIIMGNKEGNLSDDDLDYRQLTNLKVNDYRIFKLSSQLTELLKVNKKTFEPVTTFEQQPSPINEPVSPSEQFVTPAPIEPAEVDYQSMYLAEKANNERLIHENEELKNKLNTIKDTLNNLF